MDPAIRRTLNQTAYVAAFSTISSAGEQSYGTPVSVSCRVSPVTRKMFGPSGEEVSASHTILVEDEIAFSSIIWLFGADETNEKLAWRVVSRTQSINEKGENWGWLVSV